jgi:xanthine dehydrogenase accessory factor
MDKPIIIVRGGGDLATGTIHSLWSAGFGVLVLEVANPSAIRRQVSVCEALFDGEAVVENMKAVKAKGLQEAKNIISEGNVAVMIDPKGESIEALKPEIVVDAIIAKKNMGTNMNRAELTIALGPGFTAGVDVNYVVETKRGHNLGRIISSGSAVANTGIPGNIGGYTVERVIHSPADGQLKIVRNIGDIVEKGELIAVVENSNNGDITEVYASLTGIIRGMIRDGYTVFKGLKIADIDPRKEELKNCFTISDKARCIGGSVLEIVCGYYMKKMLKK